MRRNILFITTDQQRYDALGCNGGRVARTPVADRWAGEGIRYTRAHVQNVVCMPSRATMITGQHVSSTASGPMAWRCRPRRPMSRRCCAMQATARR
ncbi:MAG: sulfatase-like hydrolase/transferase [Aliidongia sp.]